MKSLNLLILFVVVLFAFSSCVTKPKMASSAELNRIKYISQSNNSEREYFLYLPRGYHDDKNKKWPVMMFLHGDGERGNGLDELDYVKVHGPLYEAWIQKRNLPFVMIVPQLHMFGRDEINIDYIDNRDTSWIPKRLIKGTPPRASLFETNQQMTGKVASPVSKFSLDGRTDAGWDNLEKDLISMINTTLTQYSVDQNRVYLSGLSYGGKGVWYIASKHPELFAAIVPVVGAGNPNLVDALAQEKLPIWGFGGGRDNASPVEDFYAVYNKLEELGHTNVRLTVHEDMGHDTWRRVYAGDDVYQWLLSHNNQLRPKSKK